jgi:hypothetical protein
VNQRSRDISDGIVNAVGRLLIAYFVIVVGTAAALALLHAIGGGIVVALGLVGIGLALILVASWHLGN